MPKSLATLVCEHLSENPDKFNPNTPISKDLEQFLRVNIEANNGRLERWIAYLLKEAYSLGAGDVESVSVRID